MPEERIHAIGVHSVANTYEARPHPSAVTQQDIDLKLPGVSVRPTTNLALLESHLKELRDQNVTRIGFERLATGHPSPDSDEAEYWREAEALAKKHGMTVYGLHKKSPIAELDAFSRLITTAMKLGRYQWNEISVLYQEQARQDRGKPQRFHDKIQTMLKAVLTHASETGTHWFSREGLERLRHAIEFEKSVWMRLDAVTQKLSHVVMNTHHVENLEALNFAEPTYVGAVNAEEIDEAERQRRAQRLRKTELKKAKKGETPNYLEEAEKRRDDHYNLQQLTAKLSAITLGQTHKRP
ncbi:hypothetical protein HY572_05975 [Candidatus Micrarchaeota archaeon]|nr:hypothetical protein [Candidatus Micrarchaeota archaeon]